jgi:hypothetical protein
MRLLAVTQVLGTLLSGRGWLEVKKQKSGKYREFIEAIKKAEYEAEVRMVAMWQKHMPEITEQSETF